MAAFLVVQVAVSDAERWRAYRDAVMPLIAQFGGKHLTAGGAETLEGGEGTSGVALFEFLSLNAIHAFWSSPEYVPVKALRKGAATLSAWALPGA